MKVAIGIPAYKAQSTIEVCLSSINIQTMRNDINVIISNDNPGDDYSYLSSRFPELHITYLDCKENGGPGVARNKAIETCKDDYITFIDADDIFYSPYAIENMYKAVNQPNIVQSQSIFVQPIKAPDGTTKLYPHVEPNHPWSFARMTNVKFLHQYGINFGTLRQMEDGRFQHCIRLLIDGSQLRVNYTKDIAYVWKEGSDHSITRSGADINDGIPVYNYGMCQIGAAVAFKQAIDFAQSKNPFNGNIPKFATEQMVNHYFTYFECKEKCAKFAKQNWWVSQWFYHNCFKPYCGNISIDVLESIFMQMLSVKGKEFKKFPELTFRQWFEKVSTDKFVFEDLVNIHNELPENIREVERRTGQLPDNILDIFNN